MEGELNPVPPFDFSKSMEFLSSFTPMANEQKIRVASFTKAVEINGKTVAFKITGKGDMQDPDIHYTAYSEERFDDETKSSLLDRITFFLSLQDDLNGFYGIGQDDENFRHIIKKLYGHKQVKFLTPFESCCWAILSQRVPMTTAHKMKEKIVQEIGSHIDIGCIDYYAFPEPTKMDAAEEPKLFEAILSRRKSKYLAAAAKAFSIVDEQWLRSAPYKEVHSWLTDIKGIGDWSANFIMMWGLGRMDELPSIGLKLALAVSSVYTGEEKPMPEEEIRTLAEKYGKWQGYWAYYIRIYAEFGGEGLKYAKGSSTQTMKAAGTENSCWPWRQPLEI